MKIKIKNYRIECIIGVYLEERHSPQTLFIDLEIRANLSKSAQTDSIHDTLDYEKVGCICKEVAAKKNYHLLESFAVEALEQLFIAFPIEWAKITVKKPNALKEADYAAIEWEKTRACDGRS